MIRGGKQGLLGLGDPGINIDIDELLNAADRLIDGDSSGIDVLEAPASQYDWRIDKYSSPDTE